MTICALLLRGHDPTSGRKLARGNRTLPGFDCTFSAPKSVSIVHALGDEFERRVISESHDAAVDAALGYLERQAAFGRRGRDGVHRVDTSGFVAAAFRHRTSRAGDPQLHTHVLVANMVKGGDGRWGAVDGRLVFAHKMDAGAVYQSHLRAEITDRLGLEWTTPRNGLAELAGVPAEVLRAFSRRRTEIEAVLAARGETSAAAAATATLATRHAKRDINPDVLREEWAERAAGARLRRRTDRADPGPPERHRRPRRAAKCWKKLTRHAVVLRSPPRRPRAGNVVVDRDPRRRARGTRRPDPDPPHRCWPRRRTNSSEPAGPPRTCSTPNTGCWRRVERGRERRRRRRRPTRGRRRRSWRGRA